jgi:ribosomal protein S27AE
MSKCGNHHVIIAQHCSAAVRLVPRIQRAREPVVRQCRSVRVYKVFRAADECPRCLAQVQSAELRQMRWHDLIAISVQNFIQFGPSNGAYF